MTWFSAVSALLAYMAAPQQGIANVDDPMWGRLRQSVAVIQQATQPSGVAVLIDSRGYFLAHSTSIPAGPVVPAMLDGRPLVLKPQAADDETSLVLLKADGWLADFGSPVKVAREEVAPGQRVTMVTVQGPSVAEVVSNNRIGQSSDTLRYTPLSELRQEDIRAKLGGAVSFNDAGELVGILGGTLPKLYSRDALAGSRPGSFGQNRSGPGFGFDANTHFGPNGLAVGYALGPVLLDRVVEGFLSPDQKVKHPSIGVFFKNGANGGASIEAVLPDSPAAKAGIQVGDVVVEANGAKVNGAVEFAVLLFNQRIGADLKLVVTRAKAGRIAVEMKVGTQSDNAQSQMFQRK